MIRIIRNVNKDSAGAGMYRAWCDECADHCRGHGRGRYQSFWIAKNGAERAAQRHQDQHTAKPNGYMYGMAKDKRPPNSGVWKEVSAIPTRSKK